MTVDQLIAQLEAFKQKYGGTAPIVVSSSDYMHYDRIHRCQGQTEVVVGPFDYEEYDRGVHDRQSHTVQVFVVS